MSISSEQSATGEHRTIEQKIAEQQHPHRDREILRELHDGREMEQEEIAQMLGCCQKTVSRWLEKTGVGGRGSYYEKGGAWCDESTLRELYLHEEKSSTEISDEFNCEPNTIRRHLHRHGIPTRTTGEAQRKDHATYRISPQGYPRWQTQEGGSDIVVGVHQLAAIAGGADPHEVFRDGVHVHHSTGHKNLNVPGLVEAVSTGEHARLHTNGEYVYDDSGWPVLVEE